MPSNPSKSSRQAYPPSLVVYAELTGARRLMLRLLLDTGATYTIIPVKAALAIGADPTVAARRIPVVTVSAVEYTPLVTIPSIRCLGLELQHIEVACHDLPPQSAVDGLLGLNVLSKLPPFCAFIQSIRTFLLPS